jgi:hypothetical protein
MKWVSSLRTYLKQSGGRGRIATWAPLIYGRFITGVPGCPARWTSKRRDESIRATRLRPIDRTEPVLVTCQSEMRDSRSASHSTLTMLTHELEGAARALQLCAHGLRASFNLVTTGSDDCHSLMAPVSVRGGNPEPPVSKQLRQASPSLGDGDSVDLRVVGSARREQWMCTACAQAMAVIVKSSC